MSRSDAYSALKAVRHLDIVQSVRDGQPARPAHVQIILSDLCNHACDFCAYRDPDYTSSTLFFEVDEKNLRKGLRKDAAHPERNYNPNRMLSYAKVGEILDDCAEMGVSGIQFTGGGEPTVHPQFKPLLAYAQMKGLKTSVVTNGSLITKRKLAQELARCSWVRVSLDAGRAEDYARIRHVPASQFADALLGVEAVVKERKRQGASVVVGVGFVVTPDNWRGIVDGVHLAKLHGADNVRISAQFSAKDADLFKDIGEEAAKLARMAEQLSDGSFTVYNRFSAKLDDLVQKAPDYETCGYQSFTTYIGADENLYRCCVYAYHPNGLYGTIKDKRFRDVWMDTERADGMAKFKASSCERCQFNAINRNLEYLLQKDEPEHAEFV